MRIIQDLAPKMQNRFEGIVITSVNKNQRWGMINYTKENHRQPLINFIKKKVTSHMIVKQKNANNIVLSHNPQKDHQYKVWTNDINRILRLRQFLRDFSYSCSTPTLRSKNNFLKHELTWCTPLSKQRDMYNHWESLNIPLRITKSNINLHVDKQKQLADYHLNQMLKYRLKYLYTQIPKDAQDIVKFYAHQIYDKEVLPLHHSEIASLIYQYPHLQLFATEISPKVSLTSQPQSLIISCLNLDGGAKRKLTNDHPYIFNIIRSHNPHVMAFLDTRLYSTPDFNIPGYSLVTFSKGDSNTYHHIGGVLIYKRIDVLNKIDIVHVNHENRYYYYIN